MDVPSQARKAVAGNYGSTVGPTEDSMDTSTTCRELAIATAQLALLILIPWCLFAGLIYSLMSLHVYMHTTLRAILVAASAALVALMVVAALLSRGRWLRKGGRIGEAEPRYLRDYSWWASLAFLSFVALLAGLTMGDLIVSSDMKRYYDITTLDSFDNVNPARTQGRQLLDAGRVVFAKGSRLDMNRSGAFKDLATYCVAPIISAPSEALPAAFDLWAAGKDCCSDEGKDFHCGAYNISIARGGIRIMDEKEVKNFRLAVQQSEEAHYIQSMHPVFFEWVANPIGDLTAKRDNALWMFFMSNLVFAVLAVVLVVLGFAFFWRMKKTRPFHAA
eukprot:TRINITY_DN105804_c0_g1_i1.p1 TRINITY_DN105804_c0_g1~~TRINITY_DN105804_c0_g1_i1.p1  ORF type:complete len:362 (+),score=53.64 TRINITY_DN105804_c0_g1_i1:90-1088(+)